MPRRKSMISFRRQQQSHKEMRYVPEKYISKPGLCRNEIQKTGFGMVVPI